MKIVDTIEGKLKLNLFQKPRVARTYRHRRYTSDNKNRHPKTEQGHRDRP